MISCYDLIKINKVMVTKFGESNYGFKNEQICKNIVSSSLDKRFDGMDFKSKYEYIAFIVCSIIENQPFYECNLHTAAFLLEYLCFKLDIKIVFEDYQLEEFLNSLLRANGGLIEDIVWWINFHEIG